MTVAAALAPSASTCSLPPTPASVPDATLPAAEATPSTTGGGPADLSAAIEQVRVAVDQLAQVVATMSPGAGVAGGGDAAAGSEVTGGGGSGCGMSGCGGGGAPAATPAAASTTQASGPGTAPPLPSAPAPATAATPTTALRTSDAQLARNIDQKVLAGTGLAGKGGVIVAAARQYKIPVDFALAVYQKEASFAKAGTLADTNNNPGNLRFADWQKEHGGVPNGGFTKYPTMDDGIKASLHLLSQGRYKEPVQRRDWGAVISIYAPTSENNTALYIEQMNEYTANFRAKLGIDENWVNS